MDHSEIPDQLERYHGESYAWALRCCSQDPVKAESVLQRVYLKVLEGRAQYHGRAAFKTWLFAVIRQTAAYQRRRAVLYRLRLLRYEQRAGSSRPGENPDDAVYRSEVQALFQRALTRLPPRQQEVLQLVFYHDLSLQEAADVMGVSLGSARVHYQRGKSRLRQWMEEWKISYE